jgi:hypothetical protein
MSCEELLYNVWRNNMFGCCQFTKKTWGIKFSNSSLEFLRIHI